jgi:hypothetical protein
MSNEHASPGGQDELFRAAQPRAITRANEASRAQKKVELKRMRYVEIEDLSICTRHTLRFRDTALKANHIYRKENDSRHSTHEET